MTPAEAIAVVREAIHEDHPTFNARALAALALIEQRMEELERELFAAQVNITPTPNELAERRRAEAAERERDEYAQQWAEVEEAIHDYWFSQKSMTAGDAVRRLLARIAQLEEALMKVRDGVEIVREEDMGLWAAAALASGKEEA